MLPLLLNQIFKNENEAKKINQDFLKRRYYYFEGN